MKQSDEVREEENNYILAVYDPTALIYLWISLVLRRHAISEGRRRGRRREGGLKEGEKWRKRYCGVYECLLFELYIFLRQGGSNCSDSEYSVTCRKGDNDGDGDVRVPSTALKANTIASSSYSQHTSSHALTLSAAPLYQLSKHCL